MRRSRSIALAATCVLAVALLITPFGQGTVLDSIGSMADNALTGLIRTLSPFHHGNCFILDRLDPTCPRYL
jgi:hypothetical protein